MNLFKRLFRLKPKKTSQQTINKSFQFHLKLLTQNTGMSKEMSEIMITPTCNAALIQAAINDGRLPS
jgi:hypothetical protein